MYAIHDRRLLAPLLAAVCVAAPAVAQQYPAKTVRFLVGFAPGGSTDIVARLIAQKLTDAWGQQVVVDNRTGAGGMISAELLAKSPPDGYTIQACTTGMFAIQPFLYKSLPYNPDKDLQHVTQSGLLPYIIVVHPSLPAKSVRDLIAIGKRRHELTLLQGKADTHRRILSEYNLRLLDDMMSLVTSATEVPQREGADHRAVFIHARTDRAGISGGDAFEDGRAGHHEEDTLDAETRLSVSTFFTRTRRFQKPFAMLVRQQGERARSGRCVTADGCAVA